MKISPVINNFYKKNNKLSFGTLYNLDEFNSRFTQLDGYFEKKLKDKVADLEKQYPNTDCYLENGTKGRESGIGVFKFVEKTREPLKSPEQTFSERLFDKPKKGVVIPKDIYSITREIEGDAMYYWSPTFNSPKSMVDHMYKIIAKGYKQLDECKKLGSELSEKCPDATKEDLVKSVVPLVVDNTSLI